jgi:hypothetical protein
MKVHFISGTCERKKNGLVLWSRNIDMDLKSRFQCGNSSKDAIYRSIKQKRGKIS